MNLDINYFKDTYLTNERFQEEAKKLAEHFQPTVEGGTIPRPCLITLSRAGDNQFGVDMAVIDGDFSDPDVKMEAVEEVGRVMADQKRQVCVVFLLSEAWVVSVSKEEVFKHTTPSQHPDKKEALIISGLTLDGRSSLFYSVFERDKKGNITKVEPVVSDFDLEHDGSMQHNLLTHFWRGYLHTTLKNEPEDFTKNTTKH